MNRWRPIAIERYYKDHPDMLSMWKVLDIKEEKSVPWYADEPMASSKKFELYGINRMNFDPKKNREHLSVVAAAIGMEALPLDMERAFKEVTKKIEANGIEGN